MRKTSAASSTVRKSGGLVRGCSGLFVIALTKYTGAERRFRDAPQRNNAQDVCRLLNGEEVSRALPMTFRVVRQKKSSFIHTCLSNADFVTPLNNKRTARSKKGERNREVSEIQRPYLPRRSTKPQKFGSCARAYNPRMARAATPAATRLLDDNVVLPVAVIRHSCPAIEAHQLTPTVTNHRRATP